MSRPTPYARAFLPWVAEWARMGLSGTQERVMLLLCSRMDVDEKGRMVGWFPRSEMAEALGVSERTVKDAIRALRDKGAIEPAAKSHRGQCQTYAIMPGNGVRLQTPLSGVKKGVRPETPHSHKGVGLDVLKGCPQTYERGTSTATPLRRKNKGAPPSFSRAGAMGKQGNRLL